jgi:hypothetical protein
MAHCIGTGELVVTELIGEVKLARIEAALAETGADRSGAAKPALGGDCSYDELEMVRAHLGRQR